MKPILALASLLITLLCFSLPVGAAGADRAENVLERRAREAAAILTAEPTWPEDLFDASFLAAVPPAKLKQLGRQLFAQTGSCTGMSQTSSRGEFSGVFDLQLEKDLVMPMTITLSDKAPHAVVGLFFGAPVPGMKDLAQLSEEFRKLPGKASFAVWKLGGKEPEVMAELAPDEPLAIGSAFKLYVLGALAKDVAKGTRKLADVVLLDARWRSLPSGEMHTWPIGSPATLATLASLMISISDNTATDHLLFTLGRSAVEAQLTAMGNRHAELSTPFLSTNELFRLKATRGGAGANEYVKLDVEKKRAYLAGEVASWPLDAEHVDSSFGTKPTHIGDLEWFASAADMCRAMDALRVATEIGPAAPVREFLAINKGLDISKDAFPWVGFKGGSEPGVIDLTYLLKSKDGVWYAFSAAWNDPKAIVEEGKFAGLVQRGIALLARRIAPAK